MLNEKGQRELVYVVKIDDVMPINGADRVEITRVGGWTVMTRKGQFHPGDLGIYFEIDSRVPEEKPFMFLEQKHFKIKTQKYFKGTVISQGLLMSFEDFIDEKGNKPIWLKELEERKDNGENIEKTFLTKDLKVIYSVEEDNQRKAKSVDKYKKMAQRKPHIFSKTWAKWFMRREWGKKLMFLIFGRKKDKKNGWPEWVSKTDEERVQNMVWILEDKTPWIATEKIDGTSTTFTYRKKGKDKGFKVCSRNVVMDTPDKKSFYDKNYYWEMENKYNIEQKLKMIVDRYNLEWATIQGETYGDGVQKRKYGLEEARDFAAFNLVFSTQGRLGSVQAREILTEYGIPFVPILTTNFVLPDAIEELLSIATDKSALDGEMREGLVFRSADGQRSFKAVSNEFLLKYHG